MAGLPWGRVAVQGVSMAPTLRSGDWLLVRWTDRVGVGDIVVVRRPDRPDLLIVKRVTRVEPGGRWVEGDNPLASDDSRLFGLVPAQNVLARVVACYWPPSRLRCLRSRLRCLRSRFPRAPGRAGGASPDL